MFEGKSTLALSPRERRRRTNADNIIPLAMEVFEMLDEYDFSGARKIPYAKKLKKQITINLDADTIDDFKASPASPVRRSSTCIWPTARREETALH